MKEWERFSFELNDGIPISKVHHIVHIPTAQRILLDTHLRANLVHDESKLKQSRICVTWFSANDWTNGSLYGNVQFSVDWEVLIDSKKIYWVECMTNYNPPAYRILFTNSNLGRSLPVVPYNPKNSIGPLRWVDGKWYRHPGLTSEFMFDMDVSLGLCNEINFVKHHNTLCPQNNNICKYMGLPQFYAAARTLAYIVGSGIHITDHCFLAQETRSPSLIYDAKIGFSSMINNLHKRKKHFLGKVKKLKHRKSVIYGVLALYGAERDLEAKNLISLFESQKTVEKTLVEVVKDHFNIDNFSLFK